MTPSSTFQQILAKVSKKLAKPFKKTFKKRSYYSGRRDRRQTISKNTTMKKFQCADATARKIESQAAPKTRFEVHPRVRAFAPYRRHARIFLATQSWDLIPLPEGRAALSTTFEQIFAKVCQNWPNHSKKPSKDAVTSRDDETDGRQFPKT